MARTKAFDQQHALDEAMALFWEQGYEATTIRDLSARAGISLSSLYATFGDKHAVYLAPLERYRQAEVEDVRRRLAAPQSLCRMVRALFADVIESLLADAAHRGSFTLNAAVEMGGRDPATVALLRRHFDDIRDLLAERLRIAQTQGELAVSHNADELAHFLLFGLYSLAMMVKLYPNRQRLEATATMTLAVLECGSGL